MGTDVLIQILIMVCILSLIIIAWLASSNSVKGKKLKRNVARIKELQNKLYNSAQELHKMNYRFNNLDYKLPNNLIALDDKGEEVNYFRIKVMDEEEEFEGFNVGDKVPHIRRKVKSTWKNVPITLKFKRQ